MFRLPDWLPPANFNSTSWSPHQRRMEILVSLQLTLRVLLRKQRHLQFSIEQKFDARPPTTGTWRAAKRSVLKRWIQAFSIELTDPPIILHIRAKRPNVGIEKTCNSALVG